MQCKRRQFHPFAAITIMTLAFLASRATDGAEISLDLVGNIVFEGAIIKDDPARFRAIVAKTHPRNIFLTSDGGDVFAAMDIGRQIRANSMWTTVVRRCVSACVFIYAGGVVRGPPIRSEAGIGLGIHRPYSTNTAPTALFDIDTRYKQLDAAVRAYFKEMNISDALADDMLRIEPKNVKFLSLDEAQRSGLEGKDAAYEDFEASNQATRFGISKQEYYQRLRRAESQCPSWLGGSAVACWQAILWGISTGEYSLRSKRLDQCYRKYDNSHTKGDEWECERAVLHGAR